MEYPKKEVELAQVELADMAQASVYSNDYARLNLITKVVEAVAQLDRYIKFLEIKINPF